MRRAHAGRRVLKRLDRAGMIMTLALEDDRQVCARVDGTGVLRARPQQHAQPTRWKRFSSGRLFL